MNESNDSNELLNNKNDERDKKREMWIERVEQTSNNIYILNSIIFKKNRIQFCKQFELFDLLQRFIKKYYLMSAKKMID